MTNGVASAQGSQPASFGHEEQRFPATLSQGMQDEDGLRGLEHRAGGPEDGDPSPADDRRGRSGGVGHAGDLSPSREKRLIDAAKRRMAAASCLRPRDRRP